MKRYRKNSIVFKTATYKLAKVFNLSPVTFKKYLDACIQDGYIIDKGDRYEIIKFNKIISDFAEKQNLYFGKHQILQSGTLNVREISNQIYQLLVCDNIIDQQQAQINRKQKDIELINFANKTEKSDSFLGKADMKRFRKLHREGKISASYVKKLSDSHNNIVITSARHTAKKLGVSVHKANSILNSKKEFHRNILVKWVSGISFCKIEMLKIQYPKALVVPMLNYNSIKVCFGSELILC